MSTVPDTSIRWRHTPNAPADSRLPTLLACQPDMTLPASADADEIGDQVGARVRELMERHRIHLDIVALVDGDEVMVVDADGDDPDIYGRASIIRAATVHPHAELIGALRELVDLLESRPDLAVGRYGTGVSVGVLRSREQLEAWATALGAEITMGGAEHDIPVVRHQLAGFRFEAQGPREARTESDR